MFKSTTVQPNPPEGTLCFTYDDGPGLTPDPLPAPGPRTLELATYLSSEGISATFFVIGQHASNHLDVLKKLKALGHLVANHTYTHPDADKWANAQVDHITEIHKTHEIIESYVSGELRVPGGEGWPKDKPELLDLLNRHTALQNYIGPVGWTIDSEDWKYWRDSCPAQQAADSVMNKIRRKKGGIVLFHDCSTEKEIELRKNNRGLELAKILVPELKKLGYQFAKLDIQLREI